MWKDIKDWEGLYEINEKGDVRNKITNKIRIWDINSAGYARVTLYCKGHVPERKRYFVHRLVAEHFIPNIFNLSEVNHIDSNKLNNHISNLEWTDRVSNELHSRIYGNKKNLYKPFKVYFDSGEMMICNVKTDLSNRLGITSTAVKYWLQGKNKGYTKYHISSIYYV